MLRPKTLEFSGIGRFVELQTIDFSRFGRLTQIDGQNNNTGGSSGAGKSTIFNALDYLLGLNDISNTVLQSRLTKEGIFVKGVFDYDGEELTITRAKKGLSVSIGGLVVEGSSKLAEEKIDQILAMPRHLFRAMLHKRQKEGGFFLAFTPKENSEFLIDCLGLNDLKSKVDILDKRLKELNEKLPKTDSLLQAKLAALKAVQDNAHTIGPFPVLEVTKQALDNLKQRRDLAYQSLELLQGSQKLEMHGLELSRPKANFVAFDTSTRENYEKELNGVKQAIEMAQATERARQESARKQIRELQDQKYALTTQITAGKQAQEEAPKIAGEIKKIRAAICPTCDQSWVTEMAKTKEQALLARISSIKEAITLGNNASVALATLAESIGLLTLDANERPIPDLVTFRNTTMGLMNKITEEKNKEKLHSQEQAAINSAAMTEFLDIQKQLTNSQSIVFSAAYNQYNLDNQVFETAQNKFNNYEVISKRYHIALNTFAEQERTYSEAVATLQAEVATLTTELSLAEEAKRIIKSYTSCSFDEALAEIGDSATKLIRNIPNMANATIQLEGTRETKDGKVKEEVNAVLHVDGEESVPIKSLSGGERSSVDLAVDLAVADLIEIRTNKGIDLVLMDEVFDGLDSINVENVLELFKSSHINKKIVIVDHNPATKAFLDSSVVVVRDGQTSKVVQ